MFFIFFFFVHVFHFCIALACGKVSHRPLLRPSHRRSEGKQYEKVENHHNNDETRRILFLTECVLFSRVSDFPVLSYPIDHRFAPPTSEAQENKKNNK